MPTVDARPFAYVFDPARTAVLMIDMQRDFLEPGGFGASLGNDVSLLREVVPGARRLLELARRSGMLLVHTRESHDANLRDCPPSKRNRGHPTLRIGDAGPMGRVLVRGEAGTAIIPELMPLDGEPVIDKPGKGAFYATRLADVLASRKISHLIVGGVTTEVCVQSTLREANDRGYDCLLVEDATGSYFPEFKAATLAMVRAQGGIVGWTATTAELAAALA